MKKFKTLLLFAEFVRDELGAVLYQVGGSIRDELMGEIPADRDYVIVGSTPDKMTDFTKVGRDFPVYLAKIGNEVSEVALARTERKTGTGYGGFEVTTDDVTIEQDLERRDLTINAIAREVLTDTIVDPFYGVKHIQAKLLTHVSDSFKEDPLRVLRVARFAARFPEFSIDSSTLVLMMTLKEEMETLTPERVGYEVAKTFTQAEDPRIFFDVLFTVGVLGVVFPEIKALFVPDRHDGTAYNHTMRLLKHAGTYVEFLALLAHDLGKGLTDPAIHPSHYGHDKLGITPAGYLANRLRLSKRAKRYMQAAAETHMKLKDFKTLRPAKKLRMVVKYHDILDTLIRVSEIDSLFRGPMDGEEVNDIEVMLDFDEIRYEVETVRRVVQIIDGDLLKSFGVTPDTNFGQKLEQARIQKLKKLLK